MRRALLAALLAVLSAASLAATSLFVLELKGGSRVFALDRPVQKGRALVFHRHPDGGYTRLRLEHRPYAAPSASPAAPRAYEHRAQRLSHARPARPARLHSPAHRLERLPDHRPAAARAALTDQAEEQP
jgi:hypothetical protein